jgi:hypothetical protein
MRSEANNCTTLLGLPRRAVDSFAPELRANVPTVTIVAAGFVVWGAFLLLML